MQFNLLKRMISMISLKQILTQQFGLLKLIDLFSIHRQSTAIFLKDEGYGDMSNFENKLNVRQRKLKNQRLYEKTQAEKCFVERKFPLEQVGKFRYFIYHWTTNVNFWHTRANIWAIRGVEPHFFFLKGIYTFYLPFDRFFEKKFLIHDVDQVGDQLILNVKEM